MSPVGFEPTTPAGERPQIYALDRAATGPGGMATWKVTSQYERHVQYLKHSIREGRDMRRVLFPENVYQFHKMQRLHRLVINSFILYDFAQIIYNKLMYA